MQAIGKPAPNGAVSPVVIYGRLRSDVDLLRNMVKHLPDADTDFHGRAQAMLTAVRRAENNLRNLLGEGA